MMMIWFELGFVSEFRWWYFDNLYEKQFVSHKIEKKKILILHSFHKMHKRNQFSKQ